LARLLKGHSKQTEMVTYYESRLLGKREWNHKPNSQPQITKIFNTKVPQTTITNTHSQAGTKPKQRNFTMERNSKNNTNAIQSSNLHHMISKRNKNTNNC
jgi:hypothetical protein